MLIAVPLTDENFKENLTKAKDLGADLIELRVDTFSRTDVEYVRDLLLSVKDEGLKTILTVRDPKEGGKQVHNREDLFIKLSPESDFTDVELMSLDLLRRVKKIVKEAGKDLIASFHDFERTPPVWVIKEIIRKALNEGAIPKVSVMANSYEDCAKLLCAGASFPGRKILIAMGKEGMVSRVAGYVFGSFISYASLGKALAPGQIPLEEMVKIRELLYS